MKDPINEAILLLTEEADSLSDCHTRKPGDWAGEPEAKAHYDHVLAVVDALSKLRAPVADERAAFIAWLTDSYPNAYSEPEAVRLWHHGHVSALAWKERGRRAALASAPVAGQAQPVAWFIDWPEEPELGHYLAESPAQTGRSRPLVFSDSVPPTSEPVYAYRRKGLDDFVTCDRERFDELSAKPRLFETRIFYAAPQASDAQCSCPSGDGSLRHPCAVHPKASETVRDMRDEKDAARWRAFERALHTRIPGPGHGTRIKVVTICPMYGEEKDVSDVRALIDAALSAQPGAQKGGCDE